MSKPLAIFTNPEKDGHSKSSNPLIPDWPFRLFACGPPNSGKRVQILNLILALPKYPDKITIIHLDQNTDEYRDLEAGSIKGDEGVEIYSPEEVPSFEYFDGDKRNLLIIDEVNMDALSKKQLSTVERLFGHASTHRNLSIILCYQQFHKVPTAIRRGCNHYILFKNIDENELGQTANRVGTPVETLKEIFADILRSPHDSLWIDLTAEQGSPYRYRLNLWNLIKRRNKAG
jgi:hypothetical protein